MNPRDAFRGGAFRRSAGRTVLVHSVAALVELVDPFTGCVRRIAQYHGRKRCVRSLEWGT